VAIKVGLSEDSQSLKILSVTDWHNHEVSQVLFATAFQCCSRNYLWYSPLLMLLLLQEIYTHLPCQRKLTEDGEEHVQAALKLKANKKLLKFQIEQTSGKHVTLRGITNMKAKLCKDGEHSSLVKIVEYLNGIKGNTCCS